MAESASKPESRRRHAVCAGHALLFAVSAFALLLALPVGRDYCEVSFSLAYSEPGENHCQVFYVDGGDDGLLELPRRALTGSGKFRFRMPCRSLKMLRIDFGSVPGDVRLTDFRCCGTRGLPLGRARFEGVNMESCRVRGDSIVGRSVHIDPFVEISPKEPIPARPDRTFFVCALASALLVFAVALVLLERRAARRENLI